MPGASTNSLSTGSLGGLARSPPPGLRGSNRGCSACKAAPRGNAAIIASAAKQSRGHIHAAPGLLLRFAPRNDEPSPSIPHPLPPLPVGLPQFTPQNLAGDVARNRVDEIDGPWDF